MAKFKVGERVRLYGHPDGTWVSGVIVRDQAASSPGYKWGDTRYEIELTHPLEVRGKALWRCDPSEIADEHRWDNILEHID